MAIRLSATRRRESEARNSPRPSGAPTESSFISFPRPRPDLGIVLEMSANLGHRPRIGLEGIELGCRTLVQIRLTQTRRRAGQSQPAQGMVGLSSQKLLVDSLRRD